MIVTVEGVDGAGKSVLCKELARRLGGIVYSTPPKAFVEVREKIGFFSNPFDSYVFYRDGLIAAAQEIAKLVPVYRNVFIDRHWVSTAASHIARGVPVDIEYISHFEMADVTILLLARPDVQRSRLTKREMSQSDVALFNLSAVMSAKYESLVLGHCRFPAVINTSDMTEPDVLNRALEVISRVPALLSA